MPPASDLDKPEDLRRLLREDRGDDCMSCRIIGGGAFLGLGAYSYFSGNAQLELQREKILKSKSIFGMTSRKFGIAGISLGLAYMGLLRLLR